MRKILTGKRKFNLLAVQQRLLYNKQSNMIHKMISPDWEGASPQSPSCPVQPELGL